MIARRILTLSAVICLATAPGAALAEATTTPEPAPAATVSLPSITVTRARTAPVTDRVLVSGTIRPVEEVSVSSQLDGMAIEELLADVGAKVEAGQVLARLKTDTLLLQKSQLEAQLASADAAIAQAEAQIAEARTMAEEAVRVRDRNRQLRKDGTVAQAALDNAEAQASAAQSRTLAAEQGVGSARAQRRLIEAQIADVDLRLSRTEVKAPVPGIVTSRNAMLGAIPAMAGQPLFMLIRDGALELRADVSEADLLRLREGQTVLIRAVGLTQPIEGRVRLVEPTVDLTTRLGLVRIAIADPSLVRSGLYASAEITVEAREALTLPVSALGTGTDSAIVMKVVDGKVTETPVTTGIRDGNLVEILSGLAADDLVVARAGAFVRDGDRINPVERDPATN